jgi:hypothetical protein
MACSKRRNLLASSTWWRQWVKWAKFEAHAKIRSHALKHTRNRICVGDVSDRELIFGVLFEVLRAQWVCREGQLVQVGKALFRILVLPR